jgi:hypothetical protein
MSKKEPKTSVEEFRVRLHREDMERRWKLEALDAMFTECEDHPYKFLQRWVNPLTDAGLSLDSALALLIEGHFRPN